MSEWTVSLTNKIRNNKNKKNKNLKKKTCGVVAKVLNCDIIISSNSSHAIRFSFGIICLEKVWTIFSNPPQLARYRFSVRQWSGRPRFNPRLSHTQVSKNDTWCRLNIQHYKVRIKSKVEQSREWSRALPYTSV